MNEYEFRLVVQHHEPFVLSDFLVLFSEHQQNIRTQHVLYAAPHIRYRERLLETKSIVSTRIVYYKTFWFKWVHSLETPFAQWTTAQHARFLEGIQTKTHFFERETRQLVTMDDHARLYTFRHADGLYRLVFEWEYGSWPQPLEEYDIPLNELLENYVCRYWNIFKQFRQFSVPPYTMRENVLRKPVTYYQSSSGDHPLKKNPLLEKECLVAHKWDGIFGIVYSYKDYIKEKWEDGIQHCRKGVTLGDGLVFAAEKLEEQGTIVLLDVYEVYGFPTASESRQSILTEFLPRLSLPDGFLVQQYRTTLDALPSPEDTFFRRQIKKDGFIRHDVRNDTIFKIKTTHSVDVVYLDGYFWLPSSQQQTGGGEGVIGKRRFPIASNDPYRQTLVNGHIYEVCIETGRVLRERPDRFTGNTWRQIENIFKDGREWKGPPIEDVDASPVACSESSKRKRRRKKQRRKE